MKTTKYIIDNTIELHLSEIVSNLEKLDEISNKININQSLKTRKEARIKSIQASLAIEGNRLTVKDVTAIINNKRVEGNKRDITEVQNAIKLYNYNESMSSNNHNGALNPYKENDLFVAHFILMNELLHKDAQGRYRDEQVLIASIKNNAQKTIYTPPKYTEIPYLMNVLFDFMITSKENEIIKSCVFHYEFEKIHSFIDGNDRLGRFWQYLILQSFNPLFKYVPIETIIKENQALYYKALKDSEYKKDCTPFIKFSIQTINTAIKNVLTISKLRMHYEYDKNEKVSQSNG